MVNIEVVRKLWQRTRDKVAAHVKFMRFQYSRGGLRNNPNVRRDLNDSMRKYIEKSVGYGKPTDENIKREIGDI